MTKNKRKALLEIIYDELNKVVEQTDGLTGRGSDRIKSFFPQGKLPQNKPGRNPTRATFDPDTAGKATDSSTFDDWHDVVGRGGGKRKYKAKWNPSPEGEPRNPIEMEDSDTEPLNWDINQKSREDKFFPEAEIRKLTRDELEKIINEMGE